MTGTGALNANGSVYTVNLAAAPYHATFLSSAVAGDGTLPLKFDGYGKPNGVAAIVVRVGNDRRTIAVDGATGKTQVTN
jgi:hypothetical protein